MDFKKTTNKDGDVAYSLTGLTTLEAALFEKAFQNPEDLRDYFEIRRKELEAGGDPKNG